MASHGAHAQDSGSGGDKGTVVLVVLLVVLLGIVAAGVWYLVSAYQANARSLQSIAELQQVAQVDGSTASSAAEDGAAAATVEGDEAEEEDAEEVELPDDPVDFAALQSANSDIVAWLTIPDTGIDLPVLQSQTDDEFYLTHDAAGSYDVYGSVYIELANAQDFSDPVTMIYGHNGEAQLRNIHYFSDEEFFKEHEELTICVPGHILTYRVISAYKFDNRHILNSFDFSDPEVLLQYFEFVENPDSLQVNVRDDLEPLTEDDRIVQLSTCMLDEFHGTSRYLVTGVLVDDQLTKEGQEALEDQEALGDWEALETQEVLTDDDLDR
jgi:sortase B